MTQTVYDAVVIGTGTAGYTLAYACSRAGKSVAVVDRQAYGGTCAMRGCQPKKYLTSAAAAVERVRAMAGIGVAGTAAIDWPALIRSQQAFTDPVPERTRTGFREAGIATYDGLARFAAPDTIVTDRGDRLRADHIVIATGAVPAPLKIPGEKHVLDSSAFLSLAHLPQHIAFIGGGYISMEFAHVAARAGARVTVLHSGSRILQPFDPDLVRQLETASEAAGIRILTKAPVQAVTAVNGAFTVNAGKDGKIEETADLVIHGAGRIPDIEPLDCAAGQVETTTRGVTVGAFMQSVSNPRVYAVGDAAGTPLRLAPTADMQAETAAAHILGAQPAPVDYTNVPSVVFTLPPLAAVGLSEAQANTDGYRVRVNTGDPTHWPSSRRIGQRHAGYKVIVDEDTKKILGAHLLGHNADEAINIFALAMKAGLTTMDLKRVLWAYPTHVSDIKYTL